MQISQIKAWLSNIFAILKLEDPEIILERSICDMQETLVKARQSYASSIADYKRLEQQHKQAIENRIKWRQKTKQYLDIGDKILAKEADDYTKLYADNASNLNDNIDIAEGTVISQKYAFRKIEIQVSELIFRRSNLLRYRFPKIEIQLNGKLDRIDTVLNMLTSKGKYIIKSLDLSCEEATSVFDDPLFLTFADPAQSVQEQRFVIMGESARGRLLMLYYTECAGTRRIISARPVTKKERKAYESDL
jgi:uncharacterized protein